MAHPSAGVRLAAGLRVTLHHVSHHNFGPPLPFYPCQLLSSTSRINAPVLLSSCELSPYPNLGFLSFSLWASVLLSPPRAPSLFPSLPPTGWAVKRERAHGRPLTTRNAALELCCRAKRLQTLLHNHWTKYGGPALCNKWPCSTIYNMANGDQQ